MIAGAGCLGYMSRWCEAAVTSSLESNIGRAVAVSVSGRAFSGQALWAAAANRREGATDAAALSAGRRDCDEDAGQTLYCCPAATTRTTQQQSRHADQIDSHHSPPPSSTKPLQSSLNLYDPLRPSLSWVTTLPAEAHEHGMLQCSTLRPWMDMYHHAP